MNKPKRFPWRLFSRLVTYQAIVILASVSAAGVSARYFFKRQFLTQVNAQMRMTLEGLARDLPALPPEKWCREHSADSGFRLTVIARDGRVICDSFRPAALMENHSERPEVVAAVQGGFGESQRFSTTLAEDMFYGAFFVKERRLILRGALRLENLAATLRVMDGALVGILVLLALVLIGFAAWSGRQLAAPIGRLLVKAQSVALRSDAQDAEGALDSEPFGELSELESSLDFIRRDLDAKAESLNREREEQAMLMGAISDAILAVDLDGAPLFYNSRFAVLFGSPALREGKSRLWELVRDPELLEGFQAALHGGKSASVKTLAAEHESGRKFFSISIAPLKRESGETYGAVGIFHDVTDLKRAEQIRIEFVANVSHELRTPLAAIKGYADTITDDLEAGRPISKDFVDIINRNTSRLVSLINDLLDLSSLESTADDLITDQVRTDELTSRILRQLQGSLQAKNHEVQVKCEAPVVAADTRRLEQVLVNLLDNANKYTPPGGKIRVAWELDATSGAVLLKVEDSGPGIPAEHHSRLFERFYRVDKARSRELGGTGLGLAIVKHIVQRHHGTVWVESQLGRGSTFICSFPQSS